MDNDTARFTPAELEKIVLGFSDRLAVIEDKLGLPMSAVDKALARDFARRREEHRLAETRRDEAYQAARAEAEKLGHRGPLDVFTHQLATGAFDPPP
jgi:hypothetical protein